MRSVRFGTKRIGIEWTTIPPALYTGRDYVDEALGENLFSDLRGGLVRDVHPDPGCIEASSIILNGWRDVVGFYTTVMRRAAQHRCVQSSPYQTGGGGHIHISRSAWGDAAGYYFSNLPEVNECTNTLQSYLTEHPWIAWAFNHPRDNITAKLGQVTGWDMSPAVRGSCDNIEFRFFDAAKDINEQVEHVAFALKLMGVRWARSLSRRPRRMPLTEALKGWETTIRGMGLPWSLYEHYSKNIRTRYGFGPRYLN